MKKLQLIVSILLLMSVLGCSDNGDDSYDDSYNNPYTEPYAEPIEIKFNVASASSLIATDEIAVEDTAASRASFAKGSSVKSFTFFNSKNKEARANHVRRASEGNESGATNLFSLDENGEASLALESNVDIKILYTLPSNNGKYLYVALDPGFEVSDDWINLNWSEETEGTRNLIQNGDCALLKVSLEDDSYSCVDEGFVAMPMSKKSQKAVSEANLKPLQEDANGTLYFLAKEFVVNKNCWDETQWDEATETEVTVERCDDGWFDLPWDNPVVLRTYNPETNITVDVTPDTNEIVNYKVIDDGTIVYVYREKDQWQYGINMISGGATNKLIDSANNWGDSLFFTVDDVGTIIYGNSGSDYYSTQGGLTFAKALNIPGVVGAKIEKTLDTSLFSTGRGSPTPARIIAADDGYMYALFLETTWDWDETAQTSSEKNILRLYRVLPYLSTPRFELELKGNWWDLMNGVDIQISKGYVYYIQKESHVTGSFSDRDTIVIQRLSDGKKSVLLNSTETISSFLNWPDRYSIYNWKLVENTLHFSGFDELNSKVVTGEIDTVKVKQGLAASEYLTIKVAASALGENATIRDLEVLGAKEPESDTGSAPVVTNIYTDKENLYSASIEFSKYMNRTDVDSKLSVVTSVYNADDGSSVDVDISTMNVWFGKNLHMIFDTNTTNAVTDPLLSNTEYTIAIDGSAKDKFEWDLASGSTPAPAITFKTLPNNGFYLTEDVKVAGITDGKVARYRQKDFLQNSWERYSLVDNSITSKNFQFDFSFKIRSDSADLEFKIKDAKKIDWDSVDWSQTTITDGDNNWTRVNSHQVDQDGKQYFYCDNGTNGYCEQNGSVLYEYIDGAQVDIDGNKYYYHSDGEDYYYTVVATNGDSSVLYYKNGYYTDSAGLVYTYRFGEYREVGNDDNYIQDWAEVTYVQGHYEDSTGATVDMPGTEWTNGGYDDLSTDSVVETINFTWLRDDEDFVSGVSNQLKQAREYYVRTSDTLADGLTDVRQDEYNNTSWSDSFGASSWVDNNSSYDWDSMVANVRLSTWGSVNGDYRTGLQDTANFNSNTSVITTGAWLKGTIKVYGATMSLSVMDDQNVSTELMKVTDFDATTRTNSGIYRIDMQIQNGEDILFDNIIVQQLDTSGNILSTGYSSDQNFSDLDNAGITNFHDYDN